MRQRMQRGGALPPRLRRPIRSRADVAMATIGGTRGMMEEALVQEPPAVALELEQRFHLFVASHRERARRLAWRLVGGDDAAAEDVIQEAFIKAYRALGQFREEASLATWFYRIVVRQAHNYCRWRTVRETWSALWHGETPARCSARIWRSTAQTSYRQGAGAAQPQPEGGVRVSAYGGFQCARGLGFDGEARGHGEEPLAPGAPGTAERACRSG